eukprot:scaffold20030_cov106-Isochrysis_galbana.AAC.1
MAWSALSEEACSCWTAASSACSLVIKRDSMSPTRASEANGASRASRLDSTCGGGGRVSRISQGGGSQKGGRGLQAEWRARVTRARSSSRLGFVRGIPHTSCTLVSAIAATSLTLRLSMWEHSLPTASARPSTRETVDRSVSRADG